MSDGQENHALWFLVAIALIAAGLWAFVELADEVLEGETRAFDLAVMLALRSPADHNDPIGPRWVEEVVRDLTSLGSLGVLSLVVLAAIGFLVLQGKHRTILLMIAAVLGGTVLSLLLKFGFDRPRPDLVAPSAYTFTSSFPSGHALLAAATYLTLGAILASVQPNRALKFYLMFLASLLTLIVGISRVYLGVHWPTDVLAGWILGAIWAMLCWLMARWLQRQGRIEGE